jgi:D-proline reductase (dithiol) PrdB
MTDKTTFFERISNAIFGIPAVAQWWAKRSAERTADLVDLAGGIPFVPFTKPLAQARIALITTAGVHLRDQQPFDMDNPDGDATFREIPHATARDALTITHKYYDHRDADRDLNIVFPLDHLRDLVEQGVLGSLAPRHYGFMGHIDGPRVDELNRQTARAVAAKLHDDQVDFALLTPA